MSENTPFLMQARPHFDENEAQALYDYAMSDGFFTEFRNTAEFERQLAEFIGCKYCFIIANGTLAIMAALMAVGVGVGDEVIMPDFTMIATPNAAKILGAVPILVDVTPTTLNLDPERVRKAITPRTKAVVHVSLCARGENLLELKQICQENNIAFIEDSAQSLGSRYRGKHLGTYGDIGCFSFSPPKIISTGQGGAVITDDDDLAYNLKRIKDFGRPRGGTDIHDYFGVNFKFTDLQAVVGLEQMKKLPMRVKRMREMWDLYYDLLKDIEQIEFIEPNDDEWIPWFIDIYIENRDELAAHLKQHGIGSRKVYPPIHSQSIYGEWNDSKEFPVTSSYSRRGLWLPSHSLVTDDDIVRVCECITNFYA